MIYCISCTVHDTMYATYDMLHIILHMYIDIYIYTLYTIYTIHCTHFSCSTYVYTYANLTHKSTSDTFRQVTDPPKKVYKNVEDGSRVAASVLEKDDSYDNVS